MTELLCLSSLEFVRRTRGSLGRESGSFPPTGNGHCCSISLSSFWRSPPPPRFPSLLGPLKLRLGDFPIIWFFMGSQDCSIQRASCEKTWRNFYGDSWEAVRNWHLLETHLCSGERPSLSQRQWEEEVPPSQRDCSTFHLTRSHTTPPFHFPPHYCFMFMNGKRRTKLLVFMNGKRGAKLLQGMKVSS